MAEARRRDGDVTSGTRSGVSGRINLYHSGPRLTAVGLAPVIGGVGGYYLWAGAISALVSD
jgi:hypothetical protein